MKTLRPYQEKAVQSFFEYWTNAQGNPLVTAPVGAGKSLIIAEFIKRACGLYPGTRILVLTHVKELLVQNAEALEEQWPMAPYGFYSAGLNRRDTFAQIIFGGIQSIHSKARHIGEIDLVLIDECHLISPSANTMYRQFLADLLEINPKLKVGGLTGTPFRAVNGWLTEGKDALFSDIAFEIPILFLIEQGYLSPVVTPPVGTKMDVTGVGTRAGDYIPGQLAEAVDKDEITLACVDDIMRLGVNRKAWLIFCASVEHAHHVADEIGSHGIDVEVVTGSTPKAERDATLERYKAGKLRCIVNVAVLTTGFNHPSIDLIAFMRPTRSPVLYIQCCGRGMRPAPGKENCMVLDFGGVVDALGPIDSVTVKSKKPGDGGGEAPIKQCPNCLSVNPAAARQCWDCGQAFPLPKSLLDAKAAREQAILSTQIKPRWADITGTIYELHEKVGMPNSIRVTYLTKAASCREWICPSHPGYARTKFERWWEERSDDTPPADTAEALASMEYLPKPIRVELRRNGKYDEIIGYQFQEAIENV